MLEVTPQDGGVKEVVNFEDEKDADLVGSGV